MNSSEKTFKSVFHSVTAPKLFELGFITVKLPQGWMQPTFLYKHKRDDIWFGCSWDWRDFYFEANLGRLFYFKDVMPRVIVVGNDLEKRIKDNKLGSYFSSQFENVNENLNKLATNNFERYYSSKEIHNQREKKLSKWIIKRIESLDELQSILKE